MKLAMIMLAAGNSRRFGGNKLLHEIEGIPMYERILTGLRKAQKILEKEFWDLECTLTVVTQYSEIEMYALEKGVNALQNPHPKEGISSSLKIGLRANRDADAALFAVSDQPWLKAETITELIRKFLGSKKEIACLAFKEDKEICLGNPCVFSGKYFGELLSLTGDTGGKRIIRKHPEDAELLFLEDAQELEDIDYR